MKVLITGASGKVGSLVARAMHEAGHELRLTDRRVRGELPGRVEVANLLDRDAAYRLLDGCEAVVQLGNHPNMQGSADAQQVFGENCTMNMNIFQAAKELGVRKVVFMSSIQTINGDRRMGESDAERKPSELTYLPLDSDTPANAKNPYSLSKIAAEHVLANWLAPCGISCVAIRLPWCCPPEVFERMKKNYSKQVQPGAFLDEGLAYVHGEDAASLVAAIVQAELPGFRIYLPAANSLLSDFSPAEAVAKFFQGVAIRGDLSAMKSLVDVSRITAETGWIPRRSLTKDR